MSSQQRTFQWQNPPLLQGGQFEGLEFVRSAIAGEIPQPPINIMMGFTKLEASEGTATFTAIPEVCHNNIGTVTAGSFASHWLDQAMAWAVVTKMPEGFFCTTTQLDVKLTRTITPATGALRAEAHTLHVGRKTATAEAKLFNSEGTLYAHGSCCCSVVKL